MKTRRLIIASIIVLLITFVSCLIISVKCLGQMIDRNSESLTSLAAEKVYNDITKTFAVPVTVSDTMANDKYFIDAILRNDSQSFIPYLNSIGDGFAFPIAFFLDNSSLIYYTKKNSYDTKKVDYEGAYQWFYNFRDSGRVFDTSISLSHDNNDSLTLYVDRRLEDYSGNFIGACGVGVTVAYIKTFLAAYEKDYDVKIFFANARNGIEISTDDKPDLSFLTKFDHTTITHKNFTACELERGRFAIGRRLMQNDWIIYVVRQHSDRSAFIPLVVENIIAFASVIIVFTLFMIVVVFIQHKKVIKSDQADKMTGLLNKEGFERKYELLLKEQSSSYAFVFVDLDNFKNVNDMLGHKTGDNAILDAAGKIRHSLDRKDYACRFGGDEFCIIYRKLSYTDFLRKLRDLCEILQEEYTNGSEKVLVSASIGAVYKNSTESVPYSDIFARADDLLYKAKNNGKNTYCFDEC